MLKSPKNWRALVGLSVLSASAGAVGAANLLPANDDVVAAAAPAPATMPKRMAGGPALADMVEAVGPAVVQIDVSPELETASASGIPQELQEMFGGYDGNGGDARSPARAAVGSGFVIDPSGIVVTNNHVVDGATRVGIKFSDGRQLTGRVLGRDAKTDLAVIRIEGGGQFEAIAWGDSDALRVGADVFAVGSPFGLGNTVTSGIVSARGREIGAGPYDDFLQVDAAINSGNSGGPLFDASGRVVGVNTAMFSPTGSNVGIGFAIPSRLAQSIVRQIVADGSVSRGRIGVALQTLTPGLARELGLDDTRGALIADVEPDGPAAAAGLRRGDVVTTFAGKPVTDGRALSRAVAEVTTDQPIATTIRREGRRATVRLRVVATREDRGQEDRGRAG